MCTVVFDARGGQALYLLNFVCDLKHVTAPFVKLMFLVKRHNRNSTTFILWPLNYFEEFGFENISPEPDIFLFRLICQYSTSLLLFAMSVHSSVTMVITC